MMTTRNTTFWKDGVPLEFQRTTCSMIPRPTPAAKAVGRDSMRATTAAASPGSSTVGPLAATPGAMPVKGALRM
jgi:hypothetical protein